MSKRESTERAATLAILLSSHYPRGGAYRIARLVYDMQAAARSAKSWEERRCSYPMDEATESRGNRRIERTQARINVVLASQGLEPSDPLEGLKHENPARIELGGDPRGPCGTLHIPGLRGDGFGDGFGVY